MFRIIAKVPISEKAWGLNFIEGEAITDNKALASKLKKKGYEVIEEIAEEATEEDLELQELKDYAKENGIDIGKSNTVAGIKKKIAEAEEVTEEESE